MIHFGDNPALDQFHWFDKSRSAGIALDSSSVPRGTKWRSQAYSKHGITRLAAVDAYSPNGAFEIPGRRALLRQFDAPDPGVCAVISGDKQEV